MTDRGFDGAKVAVLAAGQVLAFLRDNKPDIAHPGLWDLPGGGRESGEDPVACGLRETFEEAGLRLAPGDVIYQREYADAASATWFLVAKPGWLCLPAPRLGTEGQDVRWMPVDAFLQRGDAVGHLQDRLREYLGGG